MTGDLNRFIGDQFNTTIHQRETTSLMIAGAIGIETVTKAGVVYFINGHTVPVDTPKMAARALARLERLQAAGIPVPQVGTFYGSNRLESDPDICPRCGQPFDASGGKPVEGAEYICQACVAFRRAAEAGPVITASADPVVVVGEGLAARVPCRHDRFTAMQGRPETARCDDCGEPPDPADYSRVTIRYAGTIGDMLS